MVVMKFHLQKCDVTIMWAIDCSLSRRLQLYYKNNNLSVGCEGMRTRLSHCALLPDLNLNILGEKWRPLIYILIPNMTIHDSLSDNLLKETYVISHYQVLFLSSKNCSYIIHSLKSLRWDVHKLRLGQHILRLVVRHIMLVPRVRKH